MRKLAIGLGLLAGVFIFHDTRGQLSSATYQLKHTLPQSALLNPAFIPHNKVVIGLPGMSSIYHKLETGLSFSDIFDRTDSNSLILDTLHIFEKLGKRNSIEQEMDVQLLLLGIRTNNGYFSFNTRLRSQVKFVYPGDMIKWGIWGPGDDRIGNTIQLDNFSARVNSFLEFSAGYAYEVSSVLTIGGSVKFLNGLFGGKGSQSGHLYMGTDSLSIAVKDLEYSYAGPAAIEKGEFSHLILGSNNGFGLDVGFNYIVKPGVELSASVVDLGFITWRDYTDTYKSQDVEYTFKGFDVKAMLLDSANQVDMGQVLDSIKDRLLPLKTRSEDFTTSLGPKLIIGGRYELNDYNTLGVTLFSSFYKGKPDPGISLNYQLQLKEIFSLITGLSVHNKRADNVMAGFVFKPGPFQLYFVTDRLNGIILPSRTSELSFRVGLNLAIGKAGTMTY